MRAVKFDLWKGQFRTKSDSAKIQSLRENFTNISLTTHVYCSESSIENPLYKKFCLKYQLSAAPSSGTSNVSLHQQQLKWLTLC